MSVVNCASSTTVFDNTMLNNTMLNHHMLNDCFNVKRASIEDLSAILAIYNQSIVGKQATANLTPVTIDERAAWFDDHLNSHARPIYVVCTAENNADSIIVAWGSFSNLYTRPAYHISSEISIYLHQDYHGRGLGSLLSRWMLTQAPSLGIRNVVALIFTHNQPSLNLFKKLSFDQWGYMPQVCDMDGFIADVVMLGKSVVTENVADDSNKR